MFITDVIILILCCFTPPVTLFSGWDCQTPQSLYEGYSLGFFLVRQLHSDQIIFGPLPHPKSTIEMTLMESPSMLKVSDAWQKWDGTSKVCLYYTSHKMVYKHDIKWRQMHRPTQASRMLGRLVSANSVKFWYHHGGWFHVVCVLHLSGAGWS